MKAVWGPCHTVHQLSWPCGSIFLNNFALSYLNYHDEDGPILYILFRREEIDGQTFRAS